MNFKRETSSQKKILVETMSEFCKAKTDAFPNQYQIYDLADESEREQFSHHLVEHSFALIKTPQQYKSSLSNLSKIYEELFKSSDSLECDHNGDYVGYTSTPYQKQSLWFYLIEDKNALFPKLKSKKALLNQKEIENKVVDAFNDYNKIADDAIKAILKYQCTESEWINCWNKLYPPNKLNQSNHKTDNDDSKEYQNYRECQVYHRYRKDKNLSLNNLAAIHYYGNNNNKTKECSLEKLKKSKNEHEDELDAKPCGEHIDYTLITLIMSNEPGLQVRDITNFEWVDIESIIRAHNVNPKDVLLVISGLTLEALCGKVSCQHQVINSYKDKDRLSFPLFCYADPNGVIDTSLIKPRQSMRIPNQKKLICSEHLANNVLDSVNFKR